MKKILVGFTTKTSAVLPRFFCRNFRHCAVVVDGVFIQVATNGIRAFKVGKREIGKLERSGWVFVECKKNNDTWSGIHFLTCVGFAKRVLAIRNPFVWTPDQLFRIITHD